MILDRPMSIFITMPKKSRLYKMGAFPIGSRTFDRYTEM